MEGLGGNSKGSAQEFRRKVCSVRPDHGAQLRINSELAKVFDIFQRLKHFPVQLCREIYFAFGTIAEVKPNRMTRNVATFNNVWKHNCYSSGSILDNALLARASAQASSNSWL